MTYYLVYKVTEITKFAKPINILKNYRQVKKYGLVVKWLNMFLVIFNDLRTVFYQTKILFSPQTLKTSFINFQ